MCGHGQDSDGIYIGCCCVFAFVRDLCSFKSCSTYVCMLIEDLTHVSVLILCLLCAILSEAPQETKPCLPSGGRSSGSH